MSELDEISKILEGIPHEVKKARERRIFVQVPSDKLWEAVRRLRDNVEAQHVVTITGIDTGENIELLYHLWSPKVKSLITVRTTVPRDSPSIRSIVDLIPGATLYEREVHDMLGVNFINHPNLARLLLPEDWPENLHPLRKDVKLEELRKLIFGR
ncbi:MAG: hypothetical protein DRN15_00225 [Thermoprotei archaeon]|nr:MAG: hypothetical protein DRN15_00225 [Thermoprotei archaeon]RLF25321.1 MAG: hypothetical protein DRM97_02235 [Thermoprotei archaeon]